MWYVLGAVLVVTASVGAVRIYKDQQLKKNDPVAYAKLKAARKKARARRREERKKVKEAVEGKTIIKQIYVPNKLVNFVAK